jgi:uncharacterized membrane protein
MSSKEVIVIPKPKMQIIAHWVALVCIGLMWIFAAFQYTELPDRIPIHFTANGIPNSFGSKAFIWFLPALGTGIYTALFYLARMPHLFNYAQKITPENRIQQYSLGSQLVTYIGLAILVVTLNLTWLMVRLTHVPAEINAFYNRLSLPLVLILIFSPLVWYFLQAKRK